MATSYKTPGVYIEEIPKFPPSIAPVETAIPAFIGYTETAMDKVADDLLLKPKRISSLVEYEKYFGDRQPETGIDVTITETTDANDNRLTLDVLAELAEADRSRHIMHYAMQMFFANGGGPCYIVSVGPYKNIGVALDVNELQEGLEVLVKVDEPTLIVFPEAQFLTTIGNFATLHNAALLQCETLKDRFVIMDLHGDDESLSDPDATLLDAVANFRTSGIGANNLKYGACYAPNLETILDYRFDEASTAVVYTVNGVANAAVTTLTGLAGVSNQLFEMAKAAIRDLPCKLPPSSTMAGIYAAVDNSRGVWKAPANVSVTAVIKPTIEFSNVEQDQMNVDVTGGKSVNAIRPFIGKGTLVWGARTLAGNDNEWRYVNVRRLFIFIEESVKKATEQFVFEANDANTWVRIQAMIENFLTTLWRQGALQGIKPEHAFYVAVGLGKTMTPLDILEGRMIIEIGIAAVRPAEFIILKFSHKMAES
jgi:phage tail sheath protein FI